MVGRGALRSVLHNFLDTLSSRYSDLDGYWIWGQVIDDLPEEIDLLAGASLESSAAAALRRLACERFAEQLGKHRIAPDRLRAAALQLARAAGACALVNGEARAGYEVTLTASVAWERGSLTETISFCVAPHDPQLESRRAPAQRGWAR